MLSVEVCDVVTILLNLYDMFQQLSKYKLTAVSNCRSS
jgi:hypothetical protein